MSHLTFDYVEGPGRILHAFPKSTPQTKREDIRLHPDSEIEIQRSVIRLLDVPHAITKRENGVPIQLTSGHEQFDQVGTKWERTLVCV